MNVLITINKGYAEQLKVLLKSIQMSNPNEQFDIYILHRELDEKDVYQ